MSNKRLGVIAGVAVGVVAGYFLAQLFFHRPGYDKQLEEAASTVTAMCPVTLDEFTRMDNAVAPGGRKFLYNYTIMALRDSVDIPAFTEAMQGHILENVRISPEMKEMRDHKTTFIYCYHDIEGAEVARIEITPAMYQK